MAPFRQSIHLVQCPVRLFPSRLSRSSTPATWSGVGPQNSSRGQCQWNLHMSPEFVVVGNSVGAAVVGARVVGDGVGIMEGESVGDELVGSIVGSMVGVVVGCRVGLPVGLPVGLSVSGY